MQGRQQDSSVVRGHLTQLTRKRARVPIGRILSTPYTGLGCWDEKEWLVIGANGTAGIIRPDEDQYDNQYDDYYHEPNYSPLDQ